jgi:Skp family chaperone for outer membrane proteins
MIRRSFSGLVLGRHFDERNKMKYLQFFVGVLGLVYFGLPAGPAPAAGKLPTAKVAVLNYQQLVRGSIAAKQVRNDVRKLRLRYKQSFQKIELKLRAERSSLLQAKRTLTVEQFDRKRRLFEKNMIQAQRRAQDRSRQLDRIFSAAMANVQAAIVPIVQQHTAKLNVNLVVDSTQVFFAAKTLNITESVLADLNRKLKRVPIKAPAR